MIDIHKDNTPVFHLQTQVLLVWNSIKIYIPIANITVYSMLRLTKLQTLCKETESRTHQELPHKSMLTDFIAEARLEMAVKSKKTKLDTYLEERERRLRHFLHCAFSHNHLTLLHNCRVASATRTKTFSTLSMNFSAKSNTKPSAITSLYNLNTVNIPTEKQSPKKWIHHLKSLRWPIVPSLVLIIEMPSKYVELTHQCWWES